MVFIEERESESGSPPQSPDMLTQKMSFELHARGKSQICRINRNGKIWGFGRLEGK